MSKLYLGVDLGGTNIAAGVVDEKGSIIYKKSIRTNLPKAENVIENDIYSLCRGLCEENNLSLERDIEAVGIGTPGAVDGKRGFVWSNVNFGYKNWDLKGNMQRLFKKNVYVENDANTAIIAEVMAGNAKGCKDAVIITIGTGVGGGVFIDGKIFAGHNFSGTEIGHMVIEHGGRKCNCGREGCFERYASAVALSRDTQQAMEENKDSLMWKVCPDIEKVNAKTSFDAMRLGDAVAAKLVENYISYLACGIINIINIFQPQIICLGGGVSNEKEFLLNLLKPYIEKEDFARNAAMRTKLTIAKFRNDAGIIGAAMLGVNNA